MELAARVRQAETSAAFDRLPDDPEVAQRETGGADPALTPSSRGSSISERRGAKRDPDPKLIAPGTSKITRRHEALAARLGPR
jgi:hypothetical protein